jgi:hypothetical protein
VERTSDFREIAKENIVTADEEFSDLCDRRPFNDTMRQAEVAALIAIADELDDIRWILGELRAWLVGADSR